jgi:hypothetical protein
MRGSYETVLHELAAHGLGPLARPRGGVPARRAAPIDLFAKAMPIAGGGDGGNGFQELIDELHAFRQRLVAQREHAALAKRIAGNTPAGATFAKAAAGVSAMFMKSCVRPVIIMKGALTKGPRPAEVVAKAFGALQSDSSLNAEQRGRLMLGISGIADRFAKAHPILSRIDDIKEKLDATLASGHAGRAEPLIKEALKLISSGHIEGGDHARLTLLLSEIRHEIEEATANA